MEEKCICEANEILIFACSGSSNVGQIANLSALELTRQGIGRMFCLAGLGGHVSGMIESTKAGKLIVAIDGCSVACAQKTIEHIGLQPGVYIQVTDLGIEKNHSFDYPTSDVNRLVENLKKKIGAKRAVEEKN